MRLRFFALLVLSALAACGGESGATTPTQQVVTKVTITAAATTVRPGQTLQLSASATDASGAIVAAPAFVWTSSASAIATVDQTGKVTGVAIGQVQISAAVTGVTGSFAVTVVNPAPASRDTILPLGAR